MVAIMEILESLWPDAAFAEAVAAAQEPVYVYFRHDDEPAAPAHASRLLELL